MYVGKQASSLFLIALISLFAVCPTRAQSSDELLTRAEQLYRQGKFDEAIRGYRAVVESEPENASAHYGLVRALLKKDDVKAAFQSAQHALTIAPREARLHAAMGDILYRKGQFGSAQDEYQAAFNLDGNCARAYLGIAGILLTESRYKTAKNFIEKAYSLDPKDPEILLAWSSTVPKASDRIPLLRQYLELATKEEPDEIKAMQSWIGLLQELGDRRTCYLNNPPNAASLPLEKLRHDSRTSTGVALNVAVNSAKPEKLHLDTGAPGILIERKLAEKAGVRILGPSFVRGIGDQGLATVQWGLAERVRIGEIELRDCVLQVVNRRLSSGSPGVVGAYLLADFYMTIDLRNDRLELALNPQAKLMHEGSRIWEYDRTIPPGWENAILMRRVGHLLLLPARIGNDRLGWFLMDTGSWTDFLSADLAREIGETNSDPFTGVRGVSGSVEKVYRARKVTITFGRYRQTIDEMLAFDFQKLNKSVGTEVSGAFGHPTLQLFKIKLDYLNGLVDLIYRQ